MYVEWNTKDVWNINLNSRIANKVYMEINSAVMKNFDQLFDFVYNINWDKYINKWHKINVSTNIFKSMIDSERSTQSIVNKSIIKKLVWENKQRMSDINKEEINVFVQIIEDACSIFVNTSGESLHNRWYRKDAWDAPLKENLAASLVRLCNWHFKHSLLDPMCGSGTICIEAAMIAKNIAPWLYRNFAFQSFSDFDENQFEGMKNKLKEKIFEWDYKIVGYDIDKNILNIAKNNAKKANVDDIIIFEQKDIKETKTWDGYLITNPPYGKRLDQYDLKLLYENLVWIYSNWAKWCFISSREDLESMAWYDFKIKALNNNGEDVKVYLKK